MEKINIGKLIESHQMTEEYAYYKFGDDYYRVRNTAIMDRKIKCFDPALGVFVNPYKANHKLPSGYLPKIIDQCVQYVLGNGVYVEDENLDLNNYGVHFDEFMQNLGTTARKKGRAWIYLYIDGGKLKMTEIAPEQVIPVYDDYGNLESIVRHYVKDGKPVVFVYTSEEVTQYEFKQNKYEEVSRNGHYETIKLFNGREIERLPNGFGFVPFVELRNNPERLSDLYIIKPLIDIYDIVNSDFANNIDDMQDAFFTIKNYTGEGLEEFLMQLKSTKAVPVGEDGDVDIKQLQIPTEARQVFLNLTDQAIYKTSMSVDVGQLAGSSLTNVAIRARYADLDLKADKFEGEIRKMIRTLIEYISYYEGKDYSTDITLSRAKIINNQEIIEAVNASSMLLSKQTLLENHPLVNDAEEELKRIEGEGVDPLGFGDVE